ncbi:hypothetical protein EDB89DRAFT_1902272 [Lactarius sanguifluus]|nr:hypothetical protein EDB89DRAFT_1902272 [Lactarius sanguifluus]
MAWMGGADGVGVVTGRRGVARRVGVTWRVGGGGVLGRGGSAGSWRVLGQGGGESVGGGVLRAVSGWRGGWWRLGLVCRIEAAWRVGGVLACRVGSARLVGGGRVAGQDGGGSRARMGCNLQGLAPCWGGEVGWRWWGVGAGWRWLACTNGGFACRVGAAGWRWRHVVSHVGAACRGGDEWKRLACTRGRQ